MSLKAAGLKDWKNILTTFDYPIFYMNHQGIEMYIKKLISSEDKGIKSNETNNEYKARVYNLNYQIGNTMTSTTKVITGIEKGVEMPEAEIDRLKKGLKDAYDKHDILNIVGSIRVKLDELLKQMEENGTLEGVFISPFDNHFDKKKIQYEEDKMRAEAKKRGEERRRERALEY